MRVAEAVRAAAARLAVVSDTPRLDAELLIAHALGTTREAVLLGDGADPVPSAFEDLVARRLAHEPIAYIVGRRAFWTLELAVGPGVLIPRPDSETLIEAALDHFAGTPGPRRILDLGTGSGALLLAVLGEWPDARGRGIDRSLAALDAARRNAEHLGLADRATFAGGEWQGDPADDLVLCNPPYIAEGAILPREVAAYEPSVALFAGMDGLADHRRIAACLAFAPGGAACIEIGADQGASAAALYAAQGFGVALRRDLAGRDRCLLLTGR